MDYPPQWYGLPARSAPQIVWHGIISSPFHKKTKFSYEFWWFPLGSGNFWKLAIDLPSCFTHQIYEFIHDLQGKRIVGHKQSIAGPKPFVARAQIIHEFINNHTGKRVFWRNQALSDLIKTLSDKTVRRWIPHPPTFPQRGGAGGQRPEPPSEEPACRTYTRFAWPR